MPAFGYELLISMMRSESGTARGRSRTWYTPEKRAVFAPMHSASVAAAVSVNALSFASIRTASLRSDVIRLVDGNRCADVRHVYASALPMEVLSANVSGL